MTTQKTFKDRVRARAAKTGESYSAARAQLLASATHSTAEKRAAAQPVVDHEAMARSGLNDEAVQRGTGRPLATWFDLLDAWGARERTHREIARWLVDEHGVGGWWAQSLTVGYERARGMRAMHEMAAGFSVTATRTVATSADAVLDAFLDPVRRERWLGDVAMRVRRSTPEKGARFDWDEPPSRVVLGLTHGVGRVQVAIAHEKLPDAESAERLKAMWRERLAALKEMLEG
jgi:hypothetical protein